MHSAPIVCVAFHLDGAWTVQCSGEDDDGAAGWGDEGIVGWTSV
jgi:hypothetical protein